jgi:hypothetical protein
MTAVRFIRQFTGQSEPGRIVRSESTPSPRVPPRAEPPRAAPGLTPQQFRDKYELIVPSRYFVRERGFSPALLERLLVGYSKTERRVLCPIFTDDGEAVVGFASRTQYPECPACGKFHYPGKDCRWGQHRRWKIPEGFEVGNHLYGYHLALRSDRPYVVLTEGIPDALRCLDAGHPAVACFGLDLTGVQRETLLALKRPVIVGFDNDPQGRIAAGRFVQELHEAEVTGLSVPSPYKDLAEMPTRAAKRLIDVHLDNLSL